jgi:hypothetical protein
MIIHETTPRERILGYLIIAMILAFFILPLVTLFGDYYQPWPEKPGTYIHYIFRH